MLKVEMPDNLHIIFNSENNEYMMWQSELLLYSFQKIEHHGKLTNLLTKLTKLKPDYNGNILEISPHPLRNEYCPYNKPFSIIQWLKTPIKESQILIIDPDFVFVRPFQYKVKEGFPIAQGWDYIMPQSPQGILVLERHVKKNKHLAQNVGIPCLMHINDLRKIADRWLQATIDIKNDEIVNKEVGWVAEMWGFMVAAAEAGLKFQVKNLQVFGANWEKRDKEYLDHSFVHYCHSSGDWNKRYYKPWNYVTCEPPNQNAEFLFNLINEYVEKKSSRHVNPPYNRPKRGNDEIASTTGTAFNRQI